MTSTTAFDHLDDDQLRALAVQLMAQVKTLDQQVHRFNTVNEQLPHEITLAQWVRACGVQLQPLVDALRGAGTPSRTRR